MRLADLVSDGSGKLSLSKSILATAAVIASVIMVKEAWMGHLSDALFLEYLAFASGHASMSKFLDGRRPKDST